MPSVYFNGIIGVLLTIKMFRLTLPVWIWMVFLLPTQSLKSQTYLNYNQPYVSLPNAKEPFLTKSDNDEFWENIKSIREKKVGYKDTEFVKKLDWCRYVGESAVLQKKEEYTLPNVITYSTLCMHRQTGMIKYFLGTDILEMLEDEPKVGLKQ